MQRIIEKQNELERKIEHNRRSNENKISNLEEKHNKLKVHVEKVECEVVKLKQEIDGVFEEIKMLPRLDAMEEMFKKILDAKDASFAQPPQQTQNTPNESPPIIVSNM